MGPDHAGDGPAEHALSSGSLPALRRWSVSVPAETGGGAVSRRRHLCHNLVSSYQVGGSAAVPRHRPDLGGDHFEDRDGTRGSRVPVRRGNALARTERPRMCGGRAGTKPHPPTSMHSPHNSCTSTENRRSVRQTNKGRRAWQKNRRSTEKEPGKAPLTCKNTAAKAYCPGLLL